MAINDDLHRYKDVLKKQISHAFRIYLSIAIILSPLYLMNSANAASLGGWSIGGSSVQGASVVLNASKELILNGAKKIANGTAKITPPPATVAKALAGGAAAIALDLAIKELLGGVDYVLDPANNSITYTSSSKPTTTPTSKFSFYIPSATLLSNDYGNYKSCNGYYTTITALESCLKSKVNSDYEIVRNTNYSTLLSSAINRLKNSSTSQSTTISSELFFVSKQSFYYRGFDVLYVADVTLPPSSDTEHPKSIPLSTVAQQVISMAQSGNQQAQQAIKAAADTIVAEAETDSTKARPIINQFEKTSTIETTEKSTSKSESTTTTNTANPEESTTKTDTATEFPVFCGWAPTICEAANVVIQKPAEWAENIKAAYDDAVDYFKEEPTNKEPEELEIEQPQFEAEQVNLQGSTQCPQDSVSFSLMGKSYTLDMPYQPVCNALDFFRPAVLAVGAITSAYIIAGIRTKEDET